MFSFKARQRLDVHAEHDVFDEGGQPARLLQQGSSAPACSGRPGTCPPRGSRPSAANAARSIAILRRIWDFIPYLGDVWVPFVFHFDFVDKATGQPVMVSERMKAIRDRYEVTVPDPRLDFRVAACMAVALDALQSR